MNRLLPPLEDMIHPIMLTVEHLRTNTAQQPEKLYSILISFVDIILAVAT
jgi:hypothetical protein